jgi:hypothetical protein
LREVYKMAKVIPTVKEIEAFLRKEESGSALHWRKQNKQWERLAFPQKRHCQTAKIKAI